jgi:hypothetical protein
MSRWWCHKVQDAFHWVEISECLFESIYDRYLLQTNPFE